MTSVESAAVHTLKHHLCERLLNTGDPGFGAARRVWNAAVTRQPSLIALCRNTTEVALAVRTARDAGLPLSVKAGGHDWAGRALRDGGLVVDLGGMRGVAVDPERKTAVVEGGATAADLIAATAPHGLVTPTGVVGSVGMAGLTTVGGYGPLIGKHGLALDNLIGAEVVLADGTVVEADADLLWALRGGGGNFGVVTRLVYRLHELPTILAGMLMFPASQASSIFAGYREIVADAPDDLTVMTGFLPGPSVFLCPFYSGAEMSAGERAVARLRSLGTPFVDQVGAMPYAAALGMFDRNIIDDNHYLLRSRWFADLSPVAADALIAGAAAVTSPDSVLVVNHFHGAASRVAPGATAFANRTPHQVVEVIATWRPGDHADTHRTWADDVVHALDPIALPGAYPNLLGPDDDARARDSYGPNLSRLLEAKHRYDPDNVFASAVPGLV